MEQNLQHAHHTAPTAIPILLNKLIPKHPIHKFHQHPQRPTNPIPLTSQIDPLVDFIQFQSITDYEIGIIVVCVCAC